MKHILTIALLIVFACNLCAQKTSIKALSRGAKWEFNTSGKELSLAFRTPFFTDNPLLFTDADWQSGLCPLGYGRSDVKTPISFGADSAKKTISNFYLNDEAITLHKASDIDKVYLNILAEDGYAVFINGIEVARKNLSAFALSTTLANTANTSLAYEKVDITAFKAVFSPIAYLANTVAL